ncbi:MULTISPECIES: hypothetical protein [Gordonia]|uniref:hypothetical protein n=1 Tax=Gordonia TaxID=2053 RepID=UPI00257D8216|nr:MULTISPECIES: hypothetical protein [Gordonia]
MAPGRSPISAQSAGLHDRDVELCIGVSTGSDGRSDLVIDVDRIEMFALPHRSGGLCDLGPLVGVDVSVGREHAVPGKVLKGR